MANELFGVRLSRARFERGWTEQQVADHVNQFAQSQRKPVLEDDIKDWEASKSVPSAEIVAKLADVLIKQNPELGEASKAKLVKDFTFAANRDRKLLAEGKTLRSVTLSGKATFSSMLHTLRLERSVSADGLKGELSSIGDSGFEDLSAEDIFNIQISPSEPKGARAEIISQAMGINLSPREESLDRKAHTLAGEIRKFIWGVTGDQHYKARFTHPGSNKDTTLSFSTGNKSCLRLGHGHHEDVINAYERAFEINHNQKFNEPQNKQQWDALCSRWRDLANEYAAARGRQGYSR